VSVKLTKTAFLPLTIQQKADEELGRLGAKVVTAAVLEDVSRADRTPPYIKTWDTWGNRIDKVVTSDSWKRLREISIREG
jgi:Adaptive response protein AidB N-terminal domain